MHPEQEPDRTHDDLPAVDALASADPADAPDIAEGIAAALQRELDQTDQPRDVEPETSS